MLREQIHGHHVDDLLVDWPTSNRRIAASRSRSDGLSPGGLG